MSLGAPICVALLAAAPCGLAATEATTDPVGFVTVSVGGGTPSSPKLSLVSPTLLRPIEWQGVIGTISGTTINVANSPWAAGQFNGSNGHYFVEVTTGTSAGAWSDITTTTTGSITTDDNLSSFAGTGATIRIRKHVTLADFLGAQNSAGLHGAVQPADADEVFVYDGANAGIYWYYDASDNQGPAGWYDYSYNPSGGVIIAPNQGVVVKRRASGTVSFISAGTVKTGNTLVPIVPGLNVIPAIAAQGLTLASSGLYTGSNTTGFKGAIQPADSDQLTVYSPTTQTVYWYYDAADHQGPAGWYDYFYNPAGAIAIAPGSSFVIQRTAGGPAFNWTVPTPTSF